MKNLLFIFCCFIISACSGQDVKLEELLNTYAGQNKFNGSALIVHKGKVLLDKGYGFRNAAGKIKNDNNSIFQIGSVTKQFTATVLLKLQEEEKLNITDKLSKYFPGYSNGDSITLEQLITHTSGIYSYTDDQAFMSTEVAKPSNREKMMALFKDKPLQFSPGSKWQYSNSAYMLLGYIIEDVTKMPYEQAVRSYIFNPLHMDHSGFDFTHLASKEKATGYFRLTADANIPAPIVDSSVSYAAGSIYSTTGDLHKWHQSLQANTIITKTSTQTAHTPVKNNYGYGWVIDSSMGKRTIGHGGGIHGFNSNMLSIPDDNTCIILLANASNPHLDRITKSILAILYDKPYEMRKEKKAISLSDEVLKQYTGVYELTPQLIIAVSFENGKLVGKPEGQEALQLHPEKEDQFFLKEVEAQINFTRNEKKEVVAMSILQNGMVTKGNKR